MNLYKRQQSSEHKKSINKTSRWVKKHSNNRKGKFESYTLKNSNNRKRKSKSHPSKRFQLIQSEFLNDRFFLFDFFYYRFLVLNDITYSKFLFVQRKNYFLLLLLFLKLGILRSVVIFGNSLRCKPSNDQIRLNYFFQHYLYLTFKTCQKLLLIFKTKIGWL